MRRGRGYDAVSRGLGKVQRLVVEVFEASAGAAMTMDQLVLKVFGVDVAKRTHVAAISRAMHSPSLPIEIVRQRRGVKGRQWFFKLSTGAHEPSWDKLKHK